MTSISVPGVAEVYEEAGELLTEEGERWQVCTLPGMAVLKLLAWQDRPEARSKDLQDLAHIITHYGYIGQADLFDRHYDLLNENGLDITSGDYMIKVAVRLLGRHMQAIINRSEQLHYRITALLQDREILSTAWAKANNCTVAEANELMKRLLLGLTDKLPD
jgi:predicted nucleotidyltransferase